MQRTEQGGTEGLATHPSLCSIYIVETRHISGEMRKGGGTVNHHWLSVSHIHMRTHTHTHAHTHTHTQTHKLLIFRVSTLREQGEQAEFIGCN